MDPNELRKSLYNIPFINAVNANFMYLPVLLEDMISVHRKYPDSLETSDKINIRRIVDLSKALDYYTKYV